MGIRGTFLKIPLIGTDGTVFKIAEKKKDVPKIFKMGILRNVPLIPTKKGGIK